MSQFDLTLPNEVLVRQLLGTSPEGDDTYDKGSLRGLLYDPNICDRARYAEIFRLAAEITYSPERCVTFKLEVVNGLRRQPGLWDIKVVQDLLGQVEAMVNALPDGQRRNRLLELWSYHAGLVYREAGEYEQATAAQRRSAGFAPDPAKAQISRFCAAVEMTHHGLVTGDPGTMSAALAELIVEGEKLDAFRDNPDFTVQQWVLANAPTHRLYAHYLSETEYGRREADLQQMRNLPEPHLTTYRSWTSALQALEAWRTCNHADAAKFANEAMDRKHFVVQPVLIALLICARCAVVENKLDTAACLYKMVVSMPSHGGHFVRAVAKRELAALPS